MTDHDQSVENMATAFRKVLSEGLPGAEGNRAILIKRIPIICNDILQMKADIGWIKWLLMGLVAGVGAIALAYVTKII